MIDTTEILNERFALMHVPEGFRMRCSVQNCNKEHTGHFWLLDRKIMAKVPFDSRDEAIEYASEFDET